MKREKRKKQFGFQVRQFGTPRTPGEFKEPQASACAIEPMRLLHFALLGAVLFGGQLACAPTKVLDAPAGWPVEWKNRKLYHTPHAYIYASDDGSARQADDLAKRVWREFERRTDGTGTKGLLLVSGVNDEPIIADFRLYCDMQAKRAAAAEGKTLSEQELKLRHEKICATMTQKGVDPDTQLRMTSVSMYDAELSELLGFSADVLDSVDWAVVIPTVPLITKANSETIQAELHAREIGLVLQVPLLPIILFEERIRNAKAIVSRDVEVFRNQARQQSTWNDDFRQDETQAYMERRLNEELLPVITQLTDVLQAVGEQIEPLLPLPKKSESDQ